MKTLESETEKGAKLTVARNVYPEDLAVGDNVVLSELSFQYASFNWCGADTTVLPPDQPVRITYLPIFDKHEPMLIERICLPFVLCKMLDEKHCVLDLRQVRVARVDPDFAQAVQKAIAKDHKQAKHNKKKAKKKKKTQKRSDQK